MWAWLKQLQWVVKHSAQAFTDARLYTKSLEDKVCALEKVIRDRTTISVDVSMRDPNYVIVVGNYRGVDYVQTYTLSTPDLRSLIEFLRPMQRYGHMHRIDAPREFRAVIKRELER